MMLLLPGDARACGPHLQNALVNEPDAAIWAAPVADFRVEVAALTPRSAYTYQAAGALDVEAADLAGRGVDVAAWLLWRRGKGPRPAVPGELPPAWVRYADGAARWRAHDWEGATAAWRDVLALPEPQRRDRAVWATYMLAEAEAAPQAFDAVFALVDAGAPDPLGLASAALGERARRHLDRRDWRAAVDDYLAQNGTGNPGAILSLDLVVRDAAEADALGAWATDPVLRPLATAWIVAHGGPSPDEGEAERTRAWLRAVEAAGVTVPEADHLAWMAYQLGDITSTAAWLDRAPPSGLRDWLRAKLLLREGRLEEAEALLEQAAAAFPEDLAWTEGGMPRAAEAFTDGGMRPSQEAWAEAGVVRLAAGDWRGALDAFMASGHWTDAAYVAERVLTVEELVAVVDADGSGSTEGLAGRLRYLLARRLLREGQETRALPYFSGELREAAARYLDARARGEAAWTAEVRAAALWEAALLARTKGLELLGTELQPDFSLYEGDFDYMPRIEARAAEAGPTLAPTSDETARVAASAPDPDQRWHYRYTASSLAQRAAAQLADDDPRVPILLCRATRWHLDRDFERAQTFVREALRRTRAWPPEECADPTFHPERVRNLAAAGIALIGLACAGWWRRRRRG
ncbi:MAG: hypothetical protein V4850_30240 [Myxococcota bacterium]